ncbi:MAG: class I SAM-dependent methyltransferase [Nostocoides sp.]
MSWADRDSELRGIIPSPNIWSAPQTYEIENEAVDPDRIIESAIGGLLPYAGIAVLDVGCGSGFHLPRLADLGAAEVIGLEPHAPLAARARARIAGRERIAVLQASAEAVPLADGCVDLVHARWAYFFGPGSDVGVDQARRVLRPGGVLAIIDNDATTSTFGRWFTRTHPLYDPVAIERYWRRLGFRRQQLLLRWAFRTRADFEAVVRIEFPPDGAEAILAEHRGIEVDYAVNLWWWRRPS